MKIPLVTIVSLGIAAAMGIAQGTGRAGQSRPASPMNDVAERYVKLVLALGQHDADYVDAYYGPPEWKQQAESRKAPLTDLAAHTPGDAREAESLSWLQRFVAAPEDPLARDNPVGHVTASAVVARPAGESFLLVFHR